VSLLRTPNTEVRRTAAFIIGLVGRPDDCQTLVLALHDEDAETASRVEHALWSISFRGGAGPAMRSFHEGCRLMSVEAYDKAIAMFTEASTIDPDFCEAFNQCAIAHFFNAQYDDALCRYRHAARLMPAHFNAVAGMGHCYAELGDFAKALSSYRQALAINPRMSVVACVVEQLEHHDHLQSTLTTPAFSGDFAELIA